MSFSIALTGSGFADFRKALKERVGFYRELSWHNRIDHSSSYPVARKNGKQVTDVSKHSPLAIAVPSRSRHISNSSGQQVWRLLRERPPG